MSDSTLHLAVKKRDVIQVCCLLANGADPNVLDAKGSPPLAYTLTYGIGFVLEDVTRAMIWALLKAGADPRVGNAGQSLVDDANGMVTAGIEANEAHALAKMLGVK